MTMPLGKLHRRYGANLIKSSLNVILGGGLFLIGAGGLVTSLQEGQITLFTLLLAILGLVGAGLLYAVVRQLRKFVALYEHGFVIRHSGLPAVSLRYEDAQDFTPVAGRLSSRYAEKRFRPATS